LGYYSLVANNNSKSSGRTRINPVTKEVETVAGTKAGKKRNRLPIGHPQRTHDLRGPVGKKNRKSSPANDED
jgi:hypothetical protein